MWVIVAFLITGILFLTTGQETAMDFLGGYLIELSLSVDNLFVFLSVFSSYKVPEQYRHRVLRFGIIGAALLRMLFVFLGAAVVTRFEHILYLFGGILIWNGIKVLWEKEEEEEKRGGFVVRLLNGRIPITEHYHKDHFFVVAEDMAGKKRVCATPLFVVLVVIELSDILFAVDSVPAVFSVTKNPWIVYSSNLLAVLGLRQMYFGLEKLAKRFIYVKYGISVILLFTGCKLLAELFHMQVSTGNSIVFIFSVLIISILGSVILTKKEVNN